MSRSFFAPEGYRRLTINLPEELHKELRRKAVEDDSTATDIIVNLLTEKFLKAEFEKWKRETV